MQLDAVLFERSEAEQGVVDATEPSAGNEDDGISLLLNIINGQQIFRQRNHQSARTFDQDDFVFRRQFLRGGADFVQVQSPAVQTGGKMGRSWIAEDFRHGQPLFVGFLHGYAHDFTMDGDVFGDVLATGLHGLLRDHAFTLLQQLFCQHAGGDSFADIRIDTTDEVNAFHLLCSFKICTVLSASSVKKSSEIM